MQGWVTQNELAREFGVIIPVYFAPGAPAELIRRLLVITLQDTPSYLPWEQVWLVVDGDQRAAGILQELRPALGAFNILHGSENHGKLWAVRNGMRTALHDCPELAYLVARDCDGDHAASDLPAIVRAADYIMQACGHTRLLVLGARRSRQRPMGWLRGELELLLDQVTLDAVQYYLARREHALSLTLCMHSEGVDLNSGYKLYGRDLAHKLFVEDEPEYAGISEADYWHYGPETCPVVEALLAGALLAEVPRLTWDGQPTTSFGSIDPTRLYGCMFRWLFSRLDIPLDAAACWYDNRSAGLSLRSTQEGSALLTDLRSFALERPSQEVHILPPCGLTLPFV